MIRCSIDPVLRGLLPALLLLLSCAGQGRRQAEVAAAYEDFRSLLEAGEHTAAFARLSVSTRSLLDDAARGLAELGLEHVEDGHVLFRLLLEDSLLSRSLGEAGPVFMLDDSLAELSTSGTPHSSEFTLHLEEGAWKIDLEEFFTLQLDRDLEGTGLDTEALTGRQNATDQGV